jgi:hypothetical protein
MQIFRMRSLILAAVLLLSTGAGVALAQNGRRANCPCPNPGQNCPRNGSGRWIGAGRGQGAVADRPLGMRRGMGLGGGAWNLAPARPR